IELAKEETRLFVSIENKSKDEIHFYDFDSKIVSGNQQLETETNYDAEYPELHNDILPGIKSEGIVTFPAIPESGELKVLLEGYSSNYQLDFVPFEFEIEY